MPFFKNFTIFRVAFVACVFSLLAVCPASAQSNRLVRLQTSAGPIDLELNEAAAPRTVANFLAYVRSGAYDNSFFHRLVRGFVLQGGGLTWKESQEPKLGLVPVFGPLANEFDASRSNIRGTISMAKVDGQPDSATSQWFINLTDNSANLDHQNGGFSVFGRVLPPSMAVIDTLAALPLVNASTCTNFGAASVAMAQVPMFQVPGNCETVTGSHLTVSTTARELPRRFTLSDTERVLDYLEAAYPQLFFPASQVSQPGAGFIYRSYPQSQMYLGVLEGQLYVLAPAVQPGLIPLGALTSWVERAASQGY